MEPLFPEGKMHRVLFGAVMHLRNSIYVALVGLAAWATPAAAQSGLRLNSLLDQAKALTLRRAEVLSASAASDGPGKDCKAAESKCEITVTIAATQLSLTHDGRTDKYIVCSAVAANSTHYGAESSLKKKPIVWSMQINWIQPDGAPWLGNPPQGRFGFFNAPGIVLIKNEHAQIELPPMGTAPQISEEYVAHNLLTKKNTAAVYLPVILFLKPKGSSADPDYDNPTLCGAVDPKIVNG